LTPGQIFPSCVAHVHSSFFPPSFHWRLPSHPSRFFFMRRIFYPLFHCTATLQVKIPPTTPTSFSKPCFFAHEVKWTTVAWSPIHYSYDTFLLRIPLKPFPFPATLNSWSIGSCYFHVRLLIDNNPPHYWPISNHQAFFS